MFNCRWRTCSTRWEGGVIYTSEHTTDFMVAGAAAKAHTATSAHRLFTLLAARESCWCHGKVAQRAPRALCGIPNASTVTSPPRSITSDVVLICTQLRGSIRGLCTSHQARLGGSPNDDIDGGGLTSWPSCLLHLPMLHCCYMGFGFGGLDSLCSGAATHRRIRHMPSVHYPPRCAGTIKVA